MGAATSRAGGARARPRRYGLRLPSSSTPPIRCASSCPVDHLPQLSITKISHCTAVRLARSRGRRCPVANSHESGPLAAYLPAPVRSRCFVLSGVSGPLRVLCPTRNRTRLQRPRQASSINQASLRVSAAHSVSDIIRCKCSYSIQKACIWAYIFVARPAPGAARASTINRGFPVA